MKNGLQLPILSTRKSNGLSQSQRRAEKAIQVVVSRIREDLS